MAATHGDFMPNPRAETMQRWIVGDVRITRVVEGANILDAQFLLEGVDRDFVKGQDWLRPHFTTEDGQIIACRQAFLVESKGMRIIVDTCVGNDKQRHVPFFHMLQTDFLDDLALAGMPADTIDIVLCTHLHVDHVGWNTRLVDGRWVPTFANARYLFGRKEWEFWQTESEETQGGDIMGDSVRPVVEAGLVDLVEMDHVLTGEVRLIPTPGHTPGHVSVLVESRGRRLVITGDVMHHPIQCCTPDTVVNVDTDREAARLQRRRFLETYSDTPTVMLGTHFVHPTAGWIRAKGDAFFYDVGPQAEGQADLELSADGEAWKPAAQDDEALPAARP